MQKPRRMGDNAGAEVWKRRWPERGPQAQTITRVFSVRRVASPQGFMLREADDERAPTEADARS